MRFLFLNQMAGLLFRELAEDVSRRLAPGTLLTGFQETLEAPRIAELRIEAAPPYDRASLFARGVSWLKYFLTAAIHALRAPGRQFLFIVSNPPFLGLLGPIMKALRGDRYAILVYDLYPDLLENFGKVRRGGLIATLWRWFNRVTWEQADVVFTLGHDMAARMRSGFDPRRTRLGRIVLVPPWADVHAIAPLPADQNPFRREQARDGQVVILYAGNFGLTHDMESICAAAGRLVAARSDVTFLFVGAGAKQHVVEKLARSAPERVRLMPPAPVERLREVMASADIALAALEPQAAGQSFPSKTFFYLAAGAAVVACAPAATDLAALLRRHECGEVVQPGDSGALERTIAGLCDDRARLAVMKARAREAAVKHFSRALSQRFVEALRDCLNPCRP